MRAIILISYCNSCWEVRLCKLLLYINQTWLYICYVATWQQWLMSKPENEIACFPGQLPSPVSEKKMNGVIYFFLMLLFLLWSLRWIGLCHKWLFTKEKAWDWFSIPHLEVVLRIGKNLAKFMLRIFCSHSRPYDSALILHL